MILTYIKISFGNIPTRHGKDIYKKPFQEWRSYKNEVLLLLYDVLLILHIYVNTVFRSI